MNPDRNILGAVGGLGGFPGETLAASAKAISIPDGDYLLLQVM